MHLLLLLCSNFYTLKHFLATLGDLLDIAFIQFVIGSVCLDGPFELLLVPLVLFELLRHILFLFLLPLLKLSDSSLIVYVTQSAATKISACFEVVVLLGFRFD